MSKILSEITNNSSELAILPRQALLECIAMDGPGIIAMLRAKDSKILFVNKQFEHYLGYSNADIESKDVYFTDLLEDYLHERLAFQLNAVIDSIPSRSRYVIYPLKSSAGELSMFYLYASPVNNNMGVDMYYLVLHPDLSKWDMPFTSFNTRELFLEQFNSEDFGTFEWLIDVDKVFWSVGVYRIYEIDDEDHEINLFFTKGFTHPDDRERVKKEMDIALETGSDLDTEFKIITAKNKVKIIHSLARVIKNSEGRKLKLIGSIRDVTEQRHIEEDLKYKVEELNHTNRELEEFAYIASHDLQEPLRKITTYSDRLSEKYKEVLTGDGLMYLSRMIVSAENMRTLINDLLEFSRISKTEQPYQQVDMNVILKMVKTDLELVIEETGTVINSDLLPVINAIPSQMKQLLANIISNAIKFHKPGVSPVITITTNILPEKEKVQFELLKNNTYYECSISDNGIGFEEEYNTRIFQVFQRLHGKSEYPGSGIGLAICKKIIEYHHGIIYATGAPGAGAQFTFILPQDQKIPKAKKS